MKTQSFTLRIPIDLLEAIRSKMGEGTRSEFIIQTLREALGVESQQVGIDPRMADQIGKLLHEFEVFQTRIDGIVGRIEILEKAPKPIAAEPKAEPKAEYKTDSKTDSKTEDESKLPLNVPDEIPADAKIVSGGDMLRILQKEDLTGKWDGYKLRERRRNKAATKWHTIGNCKFIYKGPGPGTGKKRTHEWWAVYPLVTLDPVTSSASTAAPQEFRS
jgi:hypothetical protein